MSEIYKTFDLPTRHLDDRGYVPKRTLDRDEEERRRLLAPGTLLLEEQARGVQVADRILSLIDSDDTQTFEYAASIVALGAMNASWYSFAQNASVMRRRLQLPELAAENDEWRETRSGLFQKVRDNLLVSEIDAKKLADRNAMRKLRSDDRVRFGRGLGNISLQLGSLSIVNGAAHLSPELAQDAARRRSLELLQEAREIADSDKIYIHPSIAQLANLDSPLARHWRDQAPNRETFDLLERVQA